MSSSDLSSSSSTEDEEEHKDRADVAADPEPTESRSLRFQCPADFVSFNYKPCSSTHSSRSTELWLIKAPASFSPQSFSGVTLPLRGLETVTVPSGDGTERLYSVLGSPRCHPELRLLSPPTSLAPPFSGLISISESHVDHDANQALHVVPAVPPPSLPPGLKQRFQYFQMSMACVQRTEGEVTRKRKRKIKSEVLETLESVDVTETAIKVEIKQEPLDTGFREQPETRKKKKKKSKSAE